MYFDNDYVRVLTIHSHPQLLSLLADHTPSKHILLHLSCSNCATCNTLDNDVASLSLQYPADCLFLRCNIAKLVETAQWAGIDLDDCKCDPVRKPIMRILAAGSSLPIDIMAVHEPLGSLSSPAAQGVVEEIKRVLVHELHAVHFNDWLGDASSNLIDARVAAHPLLHNHDHDRQEGEDNGAQDCALPFSQMPDSVAAILKAPIATTTNSTDSGRSSLEALARYPSTQHDDYSGQGDDACCTAASDEDGDHDHPLAQSDEEDTNYEADDDEDICPCCRDRMAIESLSSGSRSLSRSRTRSCTDLSSSSSSEYLRSKSKSTRERPRVDTSAAGRAADSALLMSHDIDDVVAIGASGSIPTSPLVGQIRHQLPVSPSDATAHGSYNNEPLDAYVNRLEAMKQGETPPSEATGVGSAVWAFVVDNFLALFSLVVLVVALASTVRIEIVPADAGR